MAARIWRIASRPPAEAPITTMSRCSTGAGSISLLDVALAETEGCAARLSVREGCLVVWAGWSAASPQLKSSRNNLLAYNGFAGENEMNISEESTVLSSWKDIARYLGKGVRTVQRWERHLGLPVRRPIGASQKSAVVLYREDVDAWLATRFSARRTREERGPSRQVFPFCAFHPHGRHSNGARTENRQS